MGSGYPMYGYFNLIRIVDTVRDFDPLVIAPWLVLHIYNYSRLGYVPRLKWYYTDSSS